MDGAWPCLDIRDREELPGTKVADLQLFGLPLGVCTEAKPRPPAEELGMIQLAVMEVEVKRNWRHPIPC